MAKGINNLITNEYVLTREKKLALNPLGENLELSLVKTPSDGNCLISSVLVAHLANYHENYEVFIAEAKYLLDEFNLLDKSYEELYDTLSNLKKSGSYEKLQPYLLMLRKKIASVIQDYADIIFSQSYACFNDQITEEVNKQEEELALELSKIESVIHYSVSVEDKKTLLEYKKELKSQIEKMQNDPYSFYIENLQKNQTWCGTIELNAMTIITRSNINIHVAETGHILKFETVFKDETKQDLNLQFINNNHYNTFVPNLAREGLEHNLSLNKKSIEKLKAVQSENEVTSEQFQ